MADEDDIEDDEEGATDDVSLRPNENADDQAIVDRKVPKEIRDKYDVISYRSAAVILAESRRAEFDEIIKAFDRVHDHHEHDPDGWWQ